jgi:hypothetical protein
MSKECPICLSAIDKKDILYTPCFHVYHKECITKWVKEKYHSSSIPCPLCKCDISSLKPNLDINPDEIKQQTPPISSFGSFINEILSIFNGPSNNPSYGLNIYYGTLSSTPSRGNDLHNERIMTGIPPSINTRSINSGNVTNTVLRRPTISLDNRCTLLKKMADNITE